MRGLWVGVLMVVACGGSVESAKDAGTMTDDARMCADACDYLTASSDHPCATGQITIACRAGCTPVVAAKASAVKAPAGIEYFCYSGH